MRITASAAPSHARGHNGVVLPPLPAHSDRIARDFHPVPFSRPGGRHWADTHGLTGFPIRSRQPLSVPSSLLRRSEGPRLLTCFRVGGTKIPALRRRAGTTKSPRGQIAQLLYGGASPSSEVPTTFSAGFLAHGSPPAATPSHARGTMVCFAPGLPVHSDRIAQVLHLIPSFSGARRPRRTEKYCNIYIIASPRTLFNPFREIILSFG